MWETGGHGSEMRRRFLRWTDVNGISQASPDSSLSPQRRKLHGIKRFRSAVASHFNLILVVVSGVLVVLVLVSVYKGFLRIRRYSKENDPSYKVLRFGNVSAVAELYEAMGFANQPLNPSLPVVYFNVYLPSSDKTKGFKIVREQLHQISSVAKEYKGAKQPIQIQIITIGDPIQSTSALEACNDHSGLKCQLVQHHESADEVVTLQALYDHCQAHPSALVTYIHSKGTFHQSGTNDAWRRALTAAALHPDCWSHSVCSVCGLQFFTQFTTFFPGNMWTAKCRYVNQLIPPQHFQPRLENAVAAMLRLRLEGIFTSHLLRDRKDYFGLDRYHAEHWIGSHPDLLPCDMEPLERPQDVFRHSSSDLQFSLAPRHDGFAVGHNFEAHRMLHQNEQERKKEIYLLPGKLFLWNELYQRVPSPQSWVWKWFPDGAYWKSKTETHGSNTITSGTLDDSIHRLSAPERDTESLPSTGVGSFLFYVHLANPDEAKEHLQQMREHVDSETVIFLCLEGEGDDLLTKDVLSFCRSLWKECRLFASFSTTDALWDVAAKIAVTCGGSDNHGSAVTLDGLRQSGVTCLSQDCHQLFFLTCPTVVQLPFPLLFLEMTKAALQGVQLAEVRNETRWKSELNNDKSSVMEFLFDAWLAMHPAANNCVGAKPISYRSRILYLVAVLIAEVYCNQHDLQSPSCVQQWKELLGLSSAHSVSEYISNTDLNRLYKIAGTETWPR